MPKRKIIKKSEAGKAKAKTTKKSATKKSIPKKEVSKTTRKNRKEKKSIETLTHEEASRKNIPTAEYQSVMRKDQQASIQVAYKRRNKDLDPQFVWRGKDIEDWSDLVVPAPPLYIQEKIHPKVLIDDLSRRTEIAEEAGKPQLSLFSDFNGIPEEEARTEFYQHDQNWTNRMILGDSLQIMASLTEREGLRGSVQAIFIDPPYGIKFNSNFQWSTASREVKDGNVQHITREPEQVKAFRDTWKDGIHSYLTYLRDRLTVARDLLTESGSIFVQIGDENVHRVRAVLDEIFGDQHFISAIWYKKNAYDASSILSNVFDNILWYSKTNNPKIRKVYKQRSFNNSDPQFFDSIQLASGMRRKLTREEKEGKSPLPKYSEVFARNPLTSSGLSKTSSGPLFFEGKQFPCSKGSHWKTTPEGMTRLIKANRIVIKGTRPRMVRFISDNSLIPMSNLWTDTGTGGFVGDEKIYVVQTDSRAIERCLLMSTDPGDLVLDPTCGSGTTAYVAEKWGRRWITLDTSRVALTLARTRIMGSKFSYYLLADSLDGKAKTASLTKSEPDSAPTTGNIRHGFVYERRPHITLRAIANNNQIDLIWDKYNSKISSALEKLNKALKVSWEEWEVPYEADENWSSRIRKLHKEWWEHKNSRQREIDDSIALNAESESLYDCPYEHSKKVRVAGPFTVESLSPHRALTVGIDDDLFGDKSLQDIESISKAEFSMKILESMKVAGVQQAHKVDKIVFTSLSPWPGDLVCAEGRYFEGDEKRAVEKRAAIFIGPEFGTVTKPDLVSAAREAGDADFDVLITCAFNYGAHASDFNKLGRIPVLKAHINADMHMADSFKNTGKGNLFVIFGEPDIDIIEVETGQIRVKINGVDVFKPQTGEVVSDNADGIACWFIDTNYNEESFFVRHAYFLGANDPYNSLKKALKAEVAEEAWSTLKRYL